MAATLTRRTIRENCSGAGRVDKAAGVVRGVRVLGYESKNGRRYTEAAVRQARGKYEGVAVHVDHPDNPGMGRGVASKIGWLQDVRIDEGGLRGDLHLLLSHPQTATVLEAAERNPSLFGLSHNSIGSLAPKGRDGVEVVESIDEVESVDLVCRPATTRGLFESRQESHESRILERTAWGRKKAGLPARSRLAEAFDLTATPTTDDNGLDPKAVSRAIMGGASSAARTAIADALQALVDDDGISLDEMMAKLREVMADAEAAIEQAGASGVFAESWERKPRRPAPPLFQRCLAR